MDINYLLKSEQIALMREKLALTQEARHAQAILARFYGDRLRQIAFPTRLISVEAI